ncbi:hypothetical protein JHK87_018121 [Glycine soja]|nr:hypothetical protein JHK87_018121 [Glycine soja]
MKHMDDDWEDMSHAGEKGRRIRELTSVFQKTASMVVVAGTGEGVFIVRET